MIPDWQLPPGVDRGLHDYMASGEMVAGYDAMMAASPLAAFDVQYCAKWFDRPGSLIDLGCGTGRLAKAFVPRGFGYVGVDLSDEMLKAAIADSMWGDILFIKENLVELTNTVSGPFDYAACLFSTLGMVREHHNRMTVLKNVFGLLRAGGRFVLHVHNRYFRALGIRGWRNADITMPQAYGGAPLTLHHFSRSEACRMLTEVGFRILDVTPLGFDAPLKRPWLLPGLRAYGYLIAAERLAATSRTPSSSSAT
jgi:SAM-dependent methyltransferase